MRLRQLECFVKICELGSINRAAEQLHITQPALGLQVRNLEHEFGTTLLVRHTRGVEVTKGGEMLLGLARDFIQSSRDLKRRLRNAAQPNTATVTLGLSPSMTSVLLGPILEASQEQRPHLDLRLVEELSHMLLEGVESGRLNLALIFNAPDRMSLLRTPVLRERLFLVMPHDGSAQPAAPVTLAEAVARPLVMPGANDALRGLVEGEAKMRNLWLTISYGIQSVHAIKDMIERGIACGILPYGVVSREALAGDLRIHPIIEPELTRTLYLVRSAGRPITPAEERLASLIVDAVDGLARETQAVGAYRQLERPHQGAL